MNIAKTTALSFVLFFSASTAAFAQAQSPTIQVPTPDNLNGQGTAAPATELDGGSTGGGGLKAIPSTIPEVAGPGPDETTPPPIDEPGSSLLPAPQAGNVNQPNAGGQATVLTAQEVSEVIFMCSERNDWSLIPLCVKLRSR